MIVRNMKIALLNLPYDNNYGGNLQRYALMKILQNMGHSVIHLNLRFDYGSQSYKKLYFFVKKIICKLFLNRDTKTVQEEYTHKCEITDGFYQKYIVHTDIITNPAFLAQYTDFDAFIVGSDQVWRKKIAGKYLPYLFFSHLQDIKKPKIACSVSFGTDTVEFNNEEIRIYGDLYKQFKAVSVREESGLKILEQLGWNTPKAIHLLDPTFMLSKIDYQMIIQSSETKAISGNCFCYILDMTDEIIGIINDVISKKNMTPYYVSLNDNISIPQWLRAFNDAEYVITDSFHGLVFSIIFNKPFKLIRNLFRGNARFDSIMQTFNLGEYCEINWEEVNSIISKNKQLFLKFLDNSLR